VRVVVCDTGPILHLSEADALALLEKTGDVMVPSAVERELIARISDWSVRRPTWLRVEFVRDAPAWQLEQLTALAGLGAGEAEAIVLARSLSADWLLTDDAGARVIATVFGMEVHGWVGVVLWAAATRHIDAQQADSVLDRLAKSSLWITAAILAEARRALDTLFS
jgi:predicted nucleic acid-binding protein